MINVQVRPAESRELAICRTLLARAPVGPAPQVFVAVDEAENVLGAGVMGPEISAETTWGVDVAARPGWAGRVEAGLLEFARLNAGAGGASRLTTLRWFREDSDHHQRWVQWGFTQSLQRYMHQLDVQRAHERLTPLMSQLKERGWIPDSSRVIPLAEADPRAVSELHARYLGGNAEHLLPMLDGTSPGGHDREISMVLMHGSQTMGFTLGSFTEPGVCEISANALHPAARLGWADLTLKYAALEQVQRRGGRVLRFITAERHTDSRRTLAWIGGGSTWTEVQLERRCR